MVVRSWIGPQRHTARKSKGEKVVQETTGALVTNAARQPPSGARSNRRKSLLGSFDLRVDRMSGLVTARLDRCASQTEYGLPVDLSGELHGAFFRLDYRFY